MRDKEFYPEIKPDKGDGGFFLLFVILAILKLTGISDESWWWVTAPLWIPVVFYFSLLVAYLIVWTIMHVMIFFQKKFRK